MSPIVILGTGLSGYTLAREIRKLDTQIPLMLVTEDAGDYYSKPLLSSALSQGKSAADLPSADAVQMRNTLNAKILTHTRAIDIEPQTNRVITAQGATEYSSLVLSVGALPIEPAMAGDGVSEAMYVNNLADYTRFRSRIRGAKRIAIIGPGLIGCEFASDLGSQGIQVTVVGPDPAPISNLLPLPLAEDLRRVLSARLGTHWQLRTTVSSIYRTREGLDLQLTNGDNIVADAVLVAVGLRPNTALAEQAGLSINRGIVADLYLRSSQRNIYALGDCAEIAGLNLPFVMPIMHGARALAKTLTGPPTRVTYPAMPVVIKTLAHPVVVSSPPGQTTGEWDFTSLEDGIKAVYRSEQGELLGFALSGKAVEHKQALLKRMPPVLV